MTPDPFNPMVFSVTIDMVRLRQQMCLKRRMHCLVFCVKRKRSLTPLFQPFDMRDSNTYGMFQFRFDIISPTEGVIR